MEKKPWAGPAPSLIVFDFDGVLTDNRVLVLQDGTEAVMCSRADGLGFDMFRGAAVRCMVVSTETNPVVQKRCEKLRIECISGVRNKESALKELCAREGLELSSVWFVGNDLNDLGAMRISGRSICPADSHPAVLAAADTILRTSGGSGVAREIAEGLLGLTYNRAAAES
jgi:3-deoxy-D-manno-octulosonate 8-phosphate phosphatase (KDO 8-P phosphatase)